MSSAGASNASSSSGVAHQDPMSSDRRVLIIGVVTMVVLLAVGVTGSALFTGSACADLEPAPVAVGRSAAALTPYLDGPGAELDSEVRTALASGLAQLEMELGSVSGVSEVTGAESLALLDDGATAAIGPRTSWFSAAGDAVQQTVALAPPGRIVGDGGQLFALALVNDLTGQVDALRPLDGDLEAGTCVDTAVVGEPFAFHLDAGGGQLLLFRVDEDAADPGLELRNGDRGRLWSVPLAVPTAPPGILAERVVAELGPQVVILARRLGAEPRTEEQAAVVAFERADGATRWQLGSEAIADRFDGAGPLWLEPLEVADGLTLLGVSRESGDDRRPAGLLALNTDDGSVAWSAALDEPVARDSTFGVAVSGPQYVAVALEAEGQTRVVTMDRASGERIGDFEPLPGGDASLAVRGDGSVVVVTGGTYVGVVTREGSGLGRTQLPVPALDVLVTGSATTMLIELPDGGTMAVAFR